MIPRHKLGFLDVSVELSQDTIIQEEAFSL